MASYEMQHLVFTYVYMFTPPLCDAYSGAASVWHRRRYSGNQIAMFFPIIILLGLRRRVSLEK